MAIRERQVKNKRNSQGILTGKPGKVFDVNVKTYENGKQKSIAKRGFATRRETELYEAQLRLDLQTGSAAILFESWKRFRKYNALHHRDYSEFAGLPYQRYCILTAF